MQEPDLLFQGGAPGKAEAERYNSLLATGLDTSREYKQLS